MKNNIFKGLFGMLTIGLSVAGCTSYEIDMPENPEPPTVGHEVSTNVVYQANPRFFGQNDCLNALRAQLPRISEMGCDILWIMPVNEPGQLNSIGSPYCIKDFKKINPRYGNMEDLKNLVSDAHSKGMKVILDWVANHTSWDNPWVTQHSDWYKQDASGNIVSPEGWTDVAQLDFSNPEAASAMLDAMIYWIEQANIDGYRCDYVEGVPASFWTTAITALRTRKSDLIMLAESAKYDYYSMGFNMIYDWASGYTISAAYGGGKPSEVVSEGFQALSEVPAGKSILRFAFNHDVAAENNVAKMFGSPEGVEGAYVLAAMLNGTPMIYSSMDVEGLSGKLSFFDYHSMDFSAALTEDYKAINAAFRKSAEVRRGELEDFSNSKCVCFMRRIPGHNLLVAVNTSGEVQKVRTPITIAGSSMTDMIKSTNEILPVELTLEAYGYLVYMN